jgi:hypothetical protein
VAKPENHSCLSQNGKVRNLRKLYIMICGRQPLADYHSFESNPSFPFTRLLFSLVFCTFDYFQVWISFHLFQLGTNWICWICGLMSCVRSWHILVCVTSSISSTTFLSCRLIKYSVHSHLILILCDSDFLCLLLIFGCFTISNLNPQIFLPM